MTTYRTPVEVRRYDLFKLMVAVILLIIIIILLLRGRGGPPAALPETAAAPTSTEALASAPEPTATHHATNTPLPTDTPEPMPTATHTPEPTPTPEPTLTPEPPPPTPTIPPMPTPILEAPEVSEEGEVFLTGSGVPGATLDVLADGEVVGEVAVAGDGTWALPVDLDPGDYTFSVRAVDEAGESLAESEPVTFSLPAAAELVTPTIAEPEAVEPVAGETLELSGTGEPGDEVEIVDNGVVVGTAMVSDDGVWTFAYDVSEGDHSLTARAADAPETQSEAVQITVDPAEAEAEPSEPVSCADNPPHGIDQGDTYVVARCEYMGLIAARTGVTLADLIAANPQVTDPSRIYPGQVLNLPPR